MDKQAVYEHIKQQIIQEKLAPGHWFVERELCATYGLSRTPIREILWKLKSDGFLEQDEEKSERLMRDHMRDTCRQIVELFYPNMLGGASNNKNKTHEENGKIA